MSWWGTQSLLEMRDSTHIYFCRSGSSLTKFALNSKGSTHTWKGRNKLQCDREWSQPRLMEATGGTSALPNLESYAQRENKLCGNAIHPCGFRKPPMHALIAAGPQGSVGTRVPRGEMHVFVFFSHHHKLLLPRDAPQTLRDVTDMAW